MSNLFSSGKLLYTAVRAYKLENYAQASTLLDKALLINQNDFETVLWKVRTTVMLKKYKDAIDLIDSYNKKNTNSRLMQIMISWRNFCLDQVNTCKDIAILNKETDDLLMRYQHYRVINYFDFITIFFLFVAVIIIIIKFHFSLQMRNSVFGGIFSCIIAFYYYRKSILPANYYFLSQYIIDKTSQLFYSKRFRSSCLFIFIFHLLHLKRGALLPEYAITSVILFPVIEEILFRGFLYGYLQKYNKFISWTIVSIMFYLLHLETASLWHIILSIMFLKAYDDEKTILAPILLHMLNNGVFVGLKALTLV